MVVNEFIELPPDPQVGVSHDIHQVAVERLEEQAPVQEIARLRLVGGRLHPEGPDSLQRELHRLRFPVAQDAEGDLLPVELPLHDFRHLDRLPVEIDPAVAGDRMTVDGEHDIPLAEEPVGGSHLMDIGDQHPAVLVDRQPVRPACRRTEERLEGDREIRVAGVASLGDVLEEASDHRRRDHESDILGDLARVSLEGHPDHLAILQDGAAAVAGIDRRIDLDHEVRIDGRMGVEIKVDARDHAACHAQALAAERVAVDGDTTLDRGNPVEGEGNGAFQKRRILHRQQREIAVVGDELHPRLAGMACPLARQRDEAGVAHHMGVGQDPLLPSGQLDHESRSNPSADATRVPRGAVVGILIGHLDPNDTGGKIELG